MKRLPALTLAATTVLAVLTPVAAHADTYSARDVAHDVQRVEEPTQTPAPERADGDVLGARIVHARRSVVLTMRFADLTTTSDAVVHGAYLRTNEGLKREVDLVATKGRWRGKAGMSRPNGQPVRCRLRSSIDYSRNIASVTVPRSCLSNPRWVQVGLYSVSIEGETAYADDALGTGALGNAPRFSPRVRR